MPTALDRWTVWVVDDRPENQLMIRHSFGGVAGMVELVEVPSGNDFRARLAEVRNGRKAPPQFILLDFFLGDCYGLELIEEVLQLGEQSDRPILIAHSSMEAANQAMVKAGADGALPKVKGLPVVESLQRAFASPEDVRRLLANRRLPETA